MRALKILSEVYDCNESTDDLQLFVTLNPSIERIVKAMELFGKEQYNQAIKDSLEETPDEMLDYADSNDYSRGCERVENYHKAEIHKLLKP